MSTLRYSDILKDSAICNKLVDYYNGEQKKYLIKILDGSDTFGGRKKWRERGVIPRTTNTTKSIVDKSGRLYNRPPSLELWRGKTAFQDPTYNALMESSDWRPFNQNVDVMVRFLKTVIVYNEKYIPAPTMTVDQKYVFNPAKGERLLQQVLHKGNSAMLMDKARENITELAFLTKEEKSDENKIFYTVITPEVVEDWYFDHDLNEDVKYAEEVNAEGIVTAYVRHDTNKPVYGLWNKPATDIVDLQEILNLHLTDIEFAIAHQKQKQIVTNADIIDNGGSEERGTVLPQRPGASQVPDNYTMVGGKGEPGLSHVGQLGSLIKIETQGETPPYFEFKGPETDLQQLNDVVNDIIKLVAYNWDVNIDMQGDGSADSGFKLVVKELNNLSLRELRAQYATQAHRKEYEILKVMYPTLPEAELFVKFPPPALPVDGKADLEEWNMKIAAGFASPVDFLIAKENLTEEEAIAKLDKIALFNAKYGAKSAAVTPTVVNNQGNTN